MRHETAFLLKTIFGGAAVIIIVALVFFNFRNMLTWMALNNPFQEQFAVVQLSDGEIVYGHLSGVTASTIGLSDVYSLDKVSPVASSSPQSVSTSTTLSVMGGTTASAAQPVLIPVSDVPELYINRAAVLYFKFVAADDPALPYLH